MPKTLASLKPATNTKPPIAVLYGVAKVGKTSLALEFPDAAYIGTAGESPPAGVEAMSFGAIETMDDVFDAMQAMLEESHDRKTLVIDSVDGVEPLVWAETCRRNGWNDIEEPGYGKGYVAADEVWREFLGGVRALKGAGIAVVLVAHPEIVRFESPTTDPYSRYAIKLHKRAAALVQETADVIAFVNYRVSIKETKEAFGKKTTRGEGGGERQIHLEERPGFIAGNRYDMPATVPFKKGEGFVKLAEFFPAPTGVAAAKGESK